VDDTFFGTDPVDAFLSWGSDPTIRLYLPAQLGVSKKVIPGGAHIGKELLGFFADEAVSDGGDSCADLDRRRQSSGQLALAGTTYNVITTANGKCHSLTNETRGRVKFDIRCMRHD
jgi:hypothetical protein